MDDEVPRVVIGMDPHKRSVTVEVMTADESIVGGGRFGTDAQGYAQLRPSAALHNPGCGGGGRVGAGVGVEVL